MSTFAVSIEQIGDVWEHENADRLQLARLTSMSFQFVIVKGAFKTGDWVVYFPIDSVLPESIISTLGLVGKLAGAQKNRVKTIRLRGAISQGVVARPETILPGWPEGNMLQIGFDVTEQLAVTKYDPPMLVSDEGTLGRLPPMVSVYDIEGAERFSAQVEQYLLDAPVIITEKLEGSHFSADHIWYKVAEKVGLLAKLPLIKAKLEQSQGRLIEAVTIRAEMIGPQLQANHYKLAELQLGTFEIEVDSEAISAEEYIDLVEQFELQHAPILGLRRTLRDWLGSKTLAEVSNGASILNPAVPREGIVIRPMKEMRDEQLG